MEKPYNKIPKIVIIEDIDFDKEGLKGTVSYNFEVLHAFVSSQDFFEKYQSFEDEVDVLLIDYELQKSGSLLNGDQIIRRLVEENYQAKLTIVSGDEDVVAVVSKARIAGASGFSQKAISVDRYKTFITSVYETNDFIIEQGTKDAVIKKMFELLHDDTPEQQFDLEQVHTDITKLFMLGKSNEDIIQSLLREEFNDKIMTHHDYTRRFDFDYYEKNLKQELAESTQKKKKEKLALLLDFIASLDNENIDIIEKLTKLKEFAFSGQSDFIKSNLRYYSKQIDNHIHAYKLKIKSELMLPNTKKETLIYGMIYNNLITKNEIKDILQEV